LLGIVARRENDFGAGGEGARCITVGAVGDAFEYAEVNGWPPRLILIVRPN